MPATSAPLPSATALPYATAVKRLTQSHVSRIEKVQICRRLLSSQYHPNPSTAVLNLLCSLISKGAPSVQECYSIHDLQGDSEGAVQEWNLLTNALQEFKERCRGHPDHREAPRIPDAILVQGGLHLLRGPLALQKAVAASLHRIMICAQHSQDLDIHTWLFCAVAKAKSPASVILPLQRAVLSNYVALLTHEQQPDLVASAAAAVASHAVPSWLASNVERIVIQSVHASPRTFHEKFRVEVQKSEPSLPHAIQFLMRAYLKYPKRTDERRSTKKRAIWELASQDAFEFFTSTSGHFVHTIKDGGDQKCWEEATFHNRLKAIQMLYLIGGENNAYIPSSNQVRYEGNERKKSRNNKSQTSTATTALHELMYELIVIASSLQLKQNVSQHRIKLTFQAITAMVHYSPEAVKDRMPDLLAGFFLAKGKPSDTKMFLWNRTKLFCTLVSEYERRGFDEFLSHAMKIDVLESIVPILRQGRVQEVLGATFSRMREAELRACIQSLHLTAPFPTTVICGLMLIYSIVLETVSPSYVQATAIACLAQITDSFASQPPNAEIRQCQMHILSSFLVASKASNFLATSGNLRRAVVRMAFRGVAAADHDLDGDVSLVSVLLEALSPEQELSSAAEVCSNLRCLTALVYYSVQHYDMDNERALLSKALQKTFVSFGLLHNMHMKSKNSRRNASSPNLLYGDVGYNLSLQWLGSLGNLVIKFPLLEIGGKEVSMFLSQAVRCFPEKHLLWRELSEEPNWSLAVSKAAYDVLEELSESTKCETDLCDCAASRVLEHISVMPTTCFSRLDIERLLYMILHYMAAPCCPSSRLKALKTFRNLGAFCGIGKMLSILNQAETSTENQKATSPISLRRSIPHHELLIAAMRVLSSQTLEQQVSLVDSNVTALLKNAIRRLMMTSEAALETLIASSDKLYEVMSALFDFRASFESLKDAGMANEEVSMLAQDVTNCVKVMLPLGLKMVRKESLKEIPLSREAEEMLSDMFKSTSAIYRQILTKDECTFLNEILTPTFLRYLLHSNHEKKYLASSLFLELPLFEGKSKRWVAQVWVVLLWVVMKEVTHHLSAVLEKEELCTSEATWKLFSVATSLTLATGRICSTCSFPSKDSQAIAAKSSLKRHHSCEQESWTFSVSTRILSGIEEFTRKWTSAAQELSAGRMAKLQASGLLSNSEALICASLSTCLEVFTASRSWSRGNIEQVVLLTTQVLERICTCEEFLKNEGEVLANVLRICRLGVRRHPGQISSVSRVLCILLRRGIKSESKIMIIAVREAIEELCTLSKTWEVLSLLLADCCAALEEAMGADSRREAEKIAVILFKTVGEQKARQILGHLRDNGREPLRYAWELFSEKLHYSGK